MRGRQKFQCDRIALCIAALARLHSIRSQPRQPCEGSPPKSFGVENLSCVQTAHMIAAVSEIRATSTKHIRTPSALISRESRCKVIFALGSTTPSPHAVRRGLVFRRNGPQPSCRQRLVPARTAIPRLNRVSCLTAFLMQRRVHSATWSTRATCSSSKSGPGWIVEKRGRASLGGPTACSRGRETWAVCYRRAERPRPAQRHRTQNCYALVRGQQTKRNARSRLEPTAFLAGAVHAKLTPVAA